MREWMKGLRTVSLALALGPGLLLTNPAHSSRYLYAQEADALPLWEVRAGDRTLYLLGSIHVLRPEVYPLDPALYDEFDRAQAVAFELDFAEMMQAAPVMLQRGTLPEGRTLREELPAEVWAEFESKVDELPVTTAVFERMRPWFAAITLSAMVLQHAGFDAQHGLDMHFHARAVEQGKRILGLETLEDQIAVFDGLDADGQVALMRQTLDELDASAARLDEATELWRRGDAEALADMFTESMRGQPLLMERLLYERNRNWIPGIEALLRADETAIVIVGMGHLVGEGSVVALLRERGYDVVRVTCDVAACAPT